MWILQFTSFRCKLIRISEAEAAAHQFKCMRVFSSSFCECGRCCVRIICKTSSINGRCCVQMQTSKKGVFVCFKQQQKRVTGARVVTARHGISLSVSLCRSVTVILLSCFVVFCCDDCDSLSLSFVSMQFVLLRSSPSGEKEKEKNHYDLTLFPETENREVNANVNGRT
jgi:hypothetical protein